MASERVRKHFARLDNLARARQVSREVRAIRLREQLEDAHAQVICRCDEKGETLEQAIEAVIGSGTTKGFGKRLLQFAQGDR